MAVLRGANRPTNELLLVDAYRNSPQILSGVSSTHLLVFDQIEKNEGSHYNTTTGVFTVPSSGIYRIEALVGMSSPSADYFADIVNIFVVSPISFARLRRGTRIVSGTSEDYSYVSLERGFTTGYKVGITISGSTTGTTQSNRADMALTIAKIF